jgi:hypothetical protein
MSRQKTGPLLPATRFRQYLVHEIPCHQAGQHPDPYPVGQPTAQDRRLAVLLIIHSAEDNG